MQNDDILKYCNLMEEVKLRMNVIDFFWNEKGHALYPSTTIESIGLQFRKILELIAMGSLVANKSAYTKTYDNFSKAWNARILLRDLERINPDFYPCAVTEVPSTTPGVKGHIEPQKKQSFLTKEEFVKIYEKCGALVHDSNPYGSKLDYGYYKKCFPIWRNLIMQLLNKHTIRLVGSENFYLIHMKENRDGKVHHYTFAPIS